MSWLKKINFIFFLFFAFSARADGLLTIEQAVSEALNANPALKAQEASVQASKARVGIARSLDDPMVGVEFEDVPITTTDITRGMETNYSILQRIPFPSKLITQGKAAKNVYFAEQSSYEMEKINLIVETEHAFHSLYFLERALRINKELQSLWSGLVASEQARYTLGEKTSQNFLKTKIELDKLQSESMLLGAKEVETQARLNILMGRNPHEEVVLAELPKHDHPFPSYEEFEKRVLAGHPELKMARYSVTASRANASLAKQQSALPDFQTRFTYGQRYGNLDTWTAEAMINIPFLWGKNRKTIQETKAIARRMKQEEINLENESLASLKEAYARFESSRQVYDLFRSRILPHATVAMKSAQATYQTGKEDFINFIDTARGFQEAKFGSLEAFVNYHKAISHLKMAVGENYIKEVMP